MYRGEVWLVNLDPTVGTEISKKRPCVIVNDNAIKNEDNLLKQYFYDLRAKGQSFNITTSDKY